MRLMIAIFILFVCLVSFGYAKSSLKKEIVIFGNNSKPPKCYLEDNKAKGILIDIMRYVGKKMHRQFEFELSPWQRAYNRAKLGEGGIIGFSKNNERLRKFDYSDVMYYETILLVVLKGHKFRYNRISDLHGKIIGIQRGASYGEKFEKAKKNLILSKDNSGEQRLLKLLYKRIDVAILGPGKIGVEAVIRNSKILSKQKDKFIILSRPLKRDPNYLGFLKTMKMKPFLRKFNWYLRKAYQEGAIRKILNSYSH